MLGNDEKQYMELHSKLHQELHQLEQQIDELEERRDELTAVLDGSYEVSRFNTAPPQESVDFRTSIDESLVSLVAANGPIKRPVIDEHFESWNLSSDDIRRALERCKRRGLIQVKGKSKAAVWTAVK